MSLILRWYWMSCPLLSGPSQFEHASFWDPWLVSSYWVESSWRHRMGSCLPGREAWWLASWTCPEGIWMSLTYPSWTFCQRRRYSESSNSQILTFQRLSFGGSTQTFSHGESIDSMKRSQNHRRCPLCQWWRRWSDWSEEQDTRWSGHWARYSPWADWSCLPSTWGTDFWPLGHTGPGVSAHGLTDSLWSPRVGGSLDRPYQKIPILIGWNNFPEPNWTWRFCGSAPYSSSSWWHCQIFRRGSWRIRPTCWLTFSKGWRESIPRHLTIPVSWGMGPVDCAISLCTAFQSSDWVAQQWSSTIGAHGFAQVQSTSGLPRCSKSASWSCCSS